MAPIPVAGDRVVVKLGSGVLASVDGLSLDLGQIASLVDQIAALHARGVRVVLVSSGAIAAGLMELELRERPGQLAEVQALAAIGQSRLMQVYQNCFGERGLKVAQLLLTHQDLDSRLRYRNAKNTLDVLLRQESVIPIVNENDSVAVEEIKFGDNDELSAEVAVLCGARRLILLSTVDGLAVNPDGSGDVIGEVQDVGEVLHLAGAQRGRHSVGGMRSKLMAVETAVRAGIDAVIAHGRRPDVLEAAMARCSGDPGPGTLFPTAPSRDRVEVPG